MDPSRLPAWSNTPTLLLCAPDLSGGAKLIAAAIGVHTDAKFEAVISAGRIAEMLGVHLATAKRGIKELLASGWLEVRRSKTDKLVNEVNLYRWNFRQTGLLAERMQQGRTRRDLPTMGSSTSATTPIPPGSSKGATRGSSTSATHTKRDVTKKNPPSGTDDGLAQEPPSPSWLGNRTVIPTRPPRGPTPLRNRIATITIVDDSNGGPNG